MNTGLVFIYFIEKKLLMYLLLSLMNNLIVYNKSLYCVVSFFVYSLVSIKITSFCLK